MQRSGFFFHNGNNFRQPAQTKQQASSKKDISYRAALSGSPPQPPCSCHLSPPLYALQLIGEGCDPERLSDSDHLILQQLIRC